jgi:hypothetical protein
MRFAKRIARDFIKTLKMKRISAVSLGMNLNRTTAIAAVLLTSFLVIGTFQNCAPTLPLDGVVDASSIAVRATATPGGGAVTGIGTVVNNPPGTNFDGVCTSSSTDDQMAYAGPDVAGNLVAFNKGSSGTAAIWNINAGGALSHASVCNLVQTGFTVQAIGDFSGDFNKDILWRNSTTGDTVIWLMRGSSRIQTAQVATISPDFNIEGVADFDGDGKDDLLLRNSANALVVMKMNGLGAPTSIPLSMSPTATQHIVAISSYYDVAATKKKVALFFNDTSPGTAGAGQAANKPVWYMNGTDIASASFLPSGFISTGAVNYNILGVGDFSGDANADFLLQDAATGNLRIRYATYNGTNFAVLGADSPEYVAPPATWVLQDIAKFNGDAYSDWVWIVNGGTLPSLSYTPVQGTPGQLTGVQYIQSGYTFFKYSHR